MKENLEELKSYLKEYCDHFLEKGKGNFYICPFCNSGKKTNSTPAFSLNPRTKFKTFKCFSCNKQGDIFNLHGELNHLGFIETKKDLKRIFGIKDIKDTPPIIEREKQYFKQPSKELREDTTQRKETRFQQFIKEKNKELEKFERFKKNIKFVNLLEFENLSFLFELLERIESHLNNKSIIIETRKNSFIIDFGENNKRHYIICHNREDIIKKYSLIDKFTTNIINILSGKKDDLIFNSIITTFIYKVTELNKRDKLINIEFENTKTRKIITLGGYILNPTFNFYSFAKDNKEVQKFLFLLFLEKGIIKPKKLHYQNKDFINNN